MGNCGVIKNTQGAVGPKYINVLDHPAQRRKKRDSEKKKKGCEYPNLFSAIIITTDIALAADIGTTATRYSCDIGVIQGIFSQMSREALPTSKE